MRATGGVGGGGSANSNPARFAASLSVSACHVTTRAVRGSVAEGGLRATRLRLAEPAPGGAHGTAAGRTAGGDPGALGFGLCS